MRNRSISAKTVEKKIDFTEIYKRFNGNKQDIINLLAISDLVFNQLYDKHILNKRFTPEIPTPEPEKIIEPIKQPDSNPTKDNGNGAKNGNGLESAVSGLVTALQQTKTESINENQVKKIVKNEIESIKDTFQVKTHEIKNIDTGAVKTLENVTLPKCFDDILALAQMRKNILLVGPSGCGKTFLCEKLAESLELPFSFISCSPGMTESQLAGRLLPLGANGKFIFVSAEFLNFYESGGVFLLDEIDNADPNTLVFLNSALANGHLCIPNRPDNPIAKKHKNFILVAASNTFGNGGNRIYMRNQLDGSTLDRFKIGTIEMDYDIEVEKSIVEPDILSWGLEKRKIIEKQGLRRILSTRFLKDLTEMRNAFPDRYPSRYSWFLQLTIGWSTDDIEAVK